MTRFPPRSICSAGAPAAATTGSAYADASCAIGRSARLRSDAISGTQVARGSVWWVDPAVLDSKTLRDALRSLSERRPTRRDHDNQNSWSF